MVAPALIATLGLLLVLLLFRPPGWVMLLFLVALMLGAVAVLLREDGALLDVRLWAAMLMVQAVPYAAADTVSMISATPRLPGRLIVRVQDSLAQPSA